MSNTFREFFNSEKSSGILLIICTAISLLIANSSNGADYLGFWQTHLGGLSIEHWTNDALMTIFFLLMTTTKSHPHTSSNIFYTTRGDGRQYGPNGFEAVGAIAVMKPAYSFDSRRAMKGSARLIVNVQAS